MKTKEKNKNIGRPKTVKDLERLTLSLSTKEKKELARQAKTFKFSSVSSYVRFLIDHHRGKE